MQAYSSSSRVESKVFPGVIFVLRKMTEGRRTALRKMMAPYNSQLRAALREQMLISDQKEDVRDNIRWFELQDVLDSIEAEHLNPGWVTWGVGSIEGLVVEGKTLGVEDWADWPSEVFLEALDAVKTEAQLSSGERKNFESPTTSGEQEGGSPKLSIVPDAAAKDSGEIATVEFTTPPN